MTAVLLEKHLPRGHGKVVVYNDKPTDDFFEVTQVHGKEVIKPSDDAKEADGLFTCEPEKLSKALAIKTADCLPITIIGKNGVAHLHAGWRGLNLAIYNQKVVKDIIPFYAFIGPAIHWDSYEVGAEFLEHFPKSRHCFKEGKEAGKYLFNLPQAAYDLLKESYPDILIEVSDMDTYTTQGHNSFRLNKTKTRNYNVYYPEHLYIK